MLIAAGVIAVLAVVAIVIAMMFRVVVPTNEVHIVQTKGSTTSYGKGKTSNVYFNWPSWVPVVGNTCIEMPVSVFGINLSDYEAYDADRLPFRVDIKAFFRITDSNKAAERVFSTNELREQLTAILQGAARTILAKSDIESIMEGRSQYGDAFTKEVDEQLTAWGVQTVKSIELMDIRDGHDSRVIHNIMAKKKSEIEKDSRVTVAENMKLAQIKETETQRDADLAQEQATQQVGVRQAEVAKEVGIAEEQSKQSVQEQAKITTTKEMAVAREQHTKTADIQKEVAITKANEQKETQVIAAEAHKQTLTINAEGEKNEAERQADASLYTEQKNAEGIKQVGEAQAEAARLLEMANVSPQIELAQEIGENEGYQEYLIKIRQVEANETIGVENASALAKADLKILANSIPGGVKSFTDLATPEGGASMGASLEQFAMTDAGKALMAKFGIKTVDQVKDLITK